MKDGQGSEEKLMGELDRMHRHVADLESCRIPVEHHPNPNGHEQVSGHLTSTCAKVIPFPEHRIHVPSEEPLEEEPTLKKKPSFGRYLIVASFFVIFLVFVLTIVPLKVMIAPRDSEKGDPHPSTFPIHLTPSPPVQGEEDARQNIEERQEKAETIPHQTTKAISPFTRKRHYTVQVGAFRHWKNASDLIDALQKKGLEAYWIEMASKGKGPIYIVFSGYFTDRNEASEFMKDKDILKNYPDSFVRWISF